MKDNRPTTSEYHDWIKSLKSTIRSAKNKVPLTINNQLIELYWHLGKEITSKVESAKWGSGVINDIAIDLKHEFPDMKGFSRRNLYAIKQWYSFYRSEFEFVPQPVAQLPWGHNRLIISKTKDIEEALFYCQESFNNSWNRDTLEAQIDSNLRNRIGSKSNNFDNTT